MSLSLEELVVKHEQLVAYSVAESTFKNYERVFARYVSFCRSFEIPPFPLIEKSIMLFVTWLHITNGCCKQTLNSYVSGILTFATLKFGIVTIRRDWLLLTRTLGGIDRATVGEVAERKPITYDILTCMIKKLDVSYWDMFVVKCALIFGQQFLRMVSEYCAKSGSNGGNAIRVRDSRFLWVDKRLAFSVRIRMSKTNQTGRFEEYCVSCRCERFPGVCVVHSMLSLSQKKKRNGDDCLFVLENGRYLTECNLRRAIHNLLGTAYNTHSLRSGGATDLFRAGIDTDIVRLMGGWSVISFVAITRAYKKLSASDVASQIGKLFNV
jgi:hypothetical protein